MSDERVISLRNPWFTVSVGGVIAIAVISGLIGFIWLPSQHADFSNEGLWTTICRAAGAPSTWYGNDATAAAGSTGDKPSDVVVLPPLAHVTASADSIGRGATIATQNCSMCHGVHGIVQVTAPVLAGQYADVIYKELRDYQSGMRPSAIMQPIIANRSDQDLHDLANYYASLSRTGPAESSGNAAGGSDSGSASASDDAAGRSAVRLAMQGDPIRNIAPCAACHGQLDRKGAAPWLGGQSSVYLVGQLTAFAKGDRHNDINEQMRNAARHLSQEEIDALARYYAAQQ
ncbi:c-type cytochrome [Paraburkholderia sp.]|uniref:c-type cytochrome n=1 Tax=Paraburkholderia sp. TaxID=1926495 RepID=UPI0023869468|nr:c-type cytochrome [Paraburkholderia sp.]MDE1179625.1 c-type cytochrome [Paraburkholderia sp.]